MTWSTAWKEVQRTTQVQIFLLLQFFSSGFVFYLAFSPSCVMYSHLFISFLFFSFSFSPQHFYQHNRLWKITSSNAIAVQVKSFNRSGMQRKRRKRERGKKWTNKSHWLTGLKRVEQKNVLWDSEKAENREREKKWQKSIHLDGSRRKRKRREWGRKSTTNWQSSLNVFFFLNVRRCEQTIELQVLKTVVWNAFMWLHSETVKQR